MIRGEPNQAEDAHHSVVAEKPDRLQNEAWTVVTCGSPQKTITCVSEDDLITEFHPWNPDRQQNLQPEVTDLLGDSGSLYDDHPKQSLFPHDDVIQAFLTAFKPLQGDGRIEFEPLKRMGEGYQTLEVKVPPRNSKRGARDISGLTFAVKDVFNLRGRSISLCNKAYLSLGPKSKITAPIIQRMIDAGAVLLGITKLSSMIGREEPVDAIDYPAPFNPRGDGYQSPAGSSSGSAAAVAAYDWLDFSLGTDTTGSGRRPALINGVFQFSPSHDYVVLDGFVKIYAPWDVPCVFVRDIALIEPVISFWYDTSISRPYASSSKPPLIVFPLDYFPVENARQMQLIRSFVCSLQAFLQAPIQEVCIADLWKGNPPPEADSNIVQKYLLNAFVDADFYEFSRFMQVFSDNYYAKYQRAPYVTPFIRWKWGLGKKVGLDEHKDAQQRLAIYKRWFLDTVMMQNTNEAFLIMPISNVEPNYRDSAPQPVARPDGFDPLILSPLLGAPDIVVPIGQSSYFSRISGCEEVLPVATNVVGCPGSDLFLLDTIQRFLEATKRPRVVKAGSRMF